MTGSDRERDVAALAHDHSGPDWRCPACAELAVVLRDRMRWASMHWGNLHDDAWPSLARAVLDSEWLAAYEKAVAAKALRDAAKAYAALVDKVRALANEWDGYGHGRYNVHLEERLPCPACDLLADLRALAEEADQ